VDIGGGDGVVVVERQDERLRQVEQLVAEGRREIVRRREGGQVQQAERLAADLRDERAQGGDDQGEEGRQVGVAFVEREPGRAVGAGGEALVQQRRLAVAGRGAQQGERARQPVDQALAQPWSLHEIRAQERPEQLGAADGRMWRGDGAHDSPSGWKPLTAHDATLRVDAEATASVDDAPNRAVEPTDHHIAPLAVGRR
jgi:hypothetical protein